jgi:hypothetical protein
MEEGELASTNGRVGGIAKVCDWCGAEYRAKHQWGTEHFYCSGRCRANWYQEGNSRGDWLLMRVLARSYEVIAGA